MKKLLFSLLAATMLFAACSKDDNKINESKSFTYNGEAMATPYGYIFAVQNVGNDATFAFTDKDLLGDSTYNGTASAVSIKIDTFILGQTYTYMNHDSTGYDKTKNFEFAATYFKQPFAGHDFTDAATVLDSLTGGYFTFNRTSNNYSVTYELKYNNVTVKGRFNGPMNEN